MTIAIGMVTGRNGIFLASDSQGSIGNSRKTSHSKKVFFIPFTDSFGGFAMAFSGASRPATRFRQILEGVAFDAVIKSEKQVIGLVLQSMRQVADEMIAHLGAQDLTLAERERFLDDEKRAYRLILAYRYAKKPRLWLVSSRDGVPEKIEDGYVAIGTGAPLADMILGGINFSKSNINSDFALLTYALEACKKFDQKCGGSIQHLCFDPGSPVGVYPFSPDLVEAYAKAARKVLTTNYLSIGEAVTLGAMNLLDEANEFGRIRSKASRK